MQPVIIVDGVAHEAKISIVSYYDENNKYHTAIVDESTQFGMLNRYQEIYDRLQEIIEDNQKGMQYLANRLADRESYGSDLPEKRERDRLKAFTSGLVEAQKIVHEVIEEGIQLRGEEIGPYIHK